MDIQQDVLCCGCLCAGRKMIAIDDITKRQCFDRILDDIKLSQDDPPVRLCWECEAYLSRFINFQRKVKRSFRKLHNYARQNLNILDLSENSVLNIHKINIINITPEDFNENDDVRIEIVKTEVEENKQAQDASLTEVAIKSEEDERSVLSDRITDDETLDEKVRPKKKTKLKLKNGTKARKVKIKKVKRKRDVESEFYKEIEFSEKQLREEREELSSREDFLNALFKCERCILPFPNAEDLSDHVKFKHEMNASKFKCAVCECSFSNEVSFNYHMNKHKRRYECLFCKDKFYSKRKAVKHYETFHSVTHYICNVCQDGFDTEQQYQEHTSQAHSITEQSHDAQQEMFSCDQCDKTFRWKTSLRKHCETHRIETGEKRRPYCETCKLSFTTTSNLQKHVKTSSKHQIQLKLRKLKSQPDTSPVNIEQIKSSVNTARSTHRCPQCDKKFQWKGNLLRHIHSHTARANGELICVPCNRTFSSIATYKQHMKISKKHVSEDEFKYICTECGKRFANKTRLKDHVDWEHLKNYVHTCEHCQKVFKSHTSLYLHKQVVHKKDSAEHLCDHCGKAFPNPGKLRSHTLALHSAESPYKCGECGARFGWHSCLSRHQRTLHRRAVDTNA